LLRGLDLVDCDLEHAARGFCEFFFDVVKVLEEVLDIAKL